MNFENRKKIMWFLAGATVAAIGISKVSFAAAPEAAWKFQNCSRADAKHISPLIQKVAPGLAQLPLTSGQVHAKVSVEIPTGKPDSRSVTFELNGNDGKVVYSAAISSIKPFSESEERGVKHISWIYTVSRPDQVNHTFGGEGISYFVYEEFSSSGKLDSQKFTVVTRNDPYAQAVGQAMFGWIDGNRSRTYSAFEFGSQGDYLERTFTTDRRTKSKHNVAKNGRYVVAEVILGVCGSAFETIEAVHVKESLPHSLFISTDRDVQAKYVLLVPEVEAK